MFSSQELPCGPQGPSGQCPDTGHRVSAVRGIVSDCVHTFIFSGPCQKLLVCGCNLYFFLQTIFVWWSEINILPASVIIQHDNGHIYIYMNMFFLEFFNCVDKCFHKLLLFLEMLYIIISKQMHYTYTCVHFSPTK